MAAGQGDLQAPASLELSANLTQVRDGGLVHLRTQERCGGPGACFRPFHQLDPLGRRRDPMLAPRTHPVDCLAQRLDANDVNPVHQPRLIDRGGRHDDAPQTAARQGRNHRQDAWHGTDLAPERELTDQRDAARSGADLLRTQQDPERHREVQ